MFRRTHMSLVLVLVFNAAVVSAAMAAQPAKTSPMKTRAAHVEHAIAGEITKIDHAAKTMIIHTADGVDETFRLTDQTAIRGLTGVERAADSAAKASLEGAAVVLHYTENGADKTALSLEHLGKRSLKVAKGTVERVDQAGKSIVVKTAAGAEETFAVTKDLVVDTGRGVKRGAALTGESFKKGADIAVHYSEDAGGRVVHLLKHL